MPILAFSSINKAFQLKTKHNLEDNKKIAGSTGYLNADISPEKSFRLLSDPHLYVDLSRYVIRAKNISKDLVEYKVCFLFVCRYALMKITKMDSKSIRWEVYSGKYKGTFGTYSVEERSDKLSKVKFNAKLDYTKSSLPDWMIKYAVDASGNALIESTHKYLNSKKETKIGNL